MYFNGLKKSVNNKFCILIQVVKNKPQLTRIGRNKYKLKSRTFLFFSVIIRFSMDDLAQ